MSGAVDSCPTCGALFCDQVFTPATSREGNYPEIPDSSIVATPTVMSGAVEGATEVSIANAVEQFAINLWSQHPKGRGYHSPEWSEISERQRDAVRVDALRQMRGYLNTLTTPPARSYTDGIADAAKVPMDVCAIIGAAPGSSIDSALREAEAAIRLLSQEPRA